MALSDFLGQFGVELGTNAGGIKFNFIGDIIIFLIIALIAGLVTWWVVDKRSYNKTIVKFREVAGVPKRVGVERAREIQLPNTSVRAYYLKKSKFYLPRPSIESAQDEYWFFIRNDGEWMNVGISNVNLKLKEMGLKFDHSDMRMSNAALKKLVDKAYKKTKWLKEWAPYIGFSIIILMLGVAGYLVMNESAKITSSAASNVVSLNEITKTMDGILKSLSNIVSSSGVSEVVS